jgi:hypothetical protein
MSILEIVSKKLDEQLKTIDSTKKTVYMEATKLDWLMLANFQELKSIEHASGKMKLNDAMFIYNALGNWNKQTVGTRLVLFKYYIELLKEKTSLIKTGKI